MTNTDINSGLERVKDGQQKGTEGRLLYFFGMIKLVNWHSYRYLPTSLKMIKNWFIIIGQIDKAIIGKDES